MPETETQTKEPKKYTKLTKEQVARVKSLKAQGMTAKVISDNVGTSVANVYRITQIGNGHRNSTAKEPKTKVQRNGQANSLVERVKKTYAKIEANQKFHEEKAEWFASQLEELKGVFSN